MNEDFRTVAGQLQRDCATDPGCGAGHQRSLPFEDVLSDG
jgi:hypothetical protein